MNTVVIRFREQAEDLSIDKDCGSETLLYSYRMCDRNMSNN